jgi:hypothetical protein
LKHNKTLKTIDLAHTNVSLDPDLKANLELNQTLVKLDLRYTKCSQEEIAYVDSCLMKKLIKQNLKKKNY